MTRYLFVDGEYCPDGDKAIDVGRAVEGVETHNVFTLQKKSAGEKIVIKKLGPL